MNPPTTASIRGMKALCCPFGLIEEAKTVPAKGTPCSTIPCVALGVQHFLFLLACFWIWRGLFRVVYPISWPCLPFSLILFSLPDPFLVSIDSFGVSLWLWFCSHSPPPPPRLSFHPLIPSVFFTYCGSVFPSNPLPILSSLDSLFCVTYSLWFYSPLPPPPIVPLFALCVLHILLADVVRNSGAFAFPMPLHPAREAEKVVRGGGERGDDQGDCGPVQRTSICYDHGGFPFT